MTIFIDMGEGRWAWDFDTEEQANERRDYIHDRLDREWCQVDNFGFRSDCLRGMIVAPVYHTRGLT